MYTKPDRMKHRKLELQDYLKEENSKVVCLMETKTYRKKTDINDN